MENTFNKLFELEKCSVRALKETMFDCLQAYLWLGYVTRFEILGEKLRVSCEEPNRSVEFNENEDDLFVDLPIRMSTEKWALLATIHWCLNKDEEDGFYYEMCCPTRFTIHYLKGDLKDLKTTFMIAKIIGRAD